MKHIDIWWCRVYGQSQVTLSSNGSCCFRDQCWKRAVKTTLLLKYPVHMWAENLHGYDFKAFNENPWSDSPWYSEAHTCPSCTIRPERDINLYFVLELGMTLHFWLTSKDPNLKRRAYMVSYTTRNPRNATNIILLEIWKETKTTALWSFAKLHFQKEKRMRADSLQNIHYMLIQLQSWLSSITTKYHTIKQLQLSGKNHHLVNNFDFMEFFHITKEPILHWSQESTTISTRKSPKIPWWHLQKIIWKNTSRHWYSSQFQERSFHLLTYWS